MQDIPNQSKRYTIPRLINEGFLLRIPSNESKYKCDEKQILALLESIKKSKEEGNPSFCLGDMIVCREGGRHTIIDGRQRLIMLFLIGVYLASKEVNEGIWHDFVRKEKRYNRKNKKYIRLAIPYERGESWLSELISKTSGRRGLECMRMCIAGYEYFCGLKIIKDWFYQHARGSLEQGISAYLYHNLYFNFRFISEEVYQPTTKEELKALCEDESVYLGKIDTSKITDMSGLFADSKRRRFLGIEKWDVSNVEDMSYMFANSSFNHPLILWNVSKVKNMEGMFSFSCFNQWINSWDVSGCENMRYMFHISLFNQPLDRWNVSSVKDMSHMFEASSFNHPLNSWNVSNVENLSYMFFVSKYNHPLSSWNVGKVKSMSGMFYESAFNQPLDSWNVANVESMERMFMESVFNQPLNPWNVSNVGDMSHMFYGSSFNQPLDLWDVGEVWSMEGMFEGSDFNQPIDSWNVRNVEYMEYMFANSSFNQPLFSWKICPMVENSYMFLDTPYTYPLNHLVPKGYTLIDLIDDCPHSYPFDFASYPKIYTPKTKSVLKLIVKDKSIPLYAIDVSGVKDMSYLFAECGRQDWEFCGIESWDMSGVENVEGMFEGSEYSQVEKFCEMKGIKP